MGLKEVCFRLEFWICCLYFFFWKRSRIPGSLHLQCCWGWPWTLHPAPSQLPRACISLHWFVRCWGSNPRLHSNGATAPRPPSPLCLIFSEPPSGYIAHWAHWGKEQLSGPDFSGLKEPPILGQRIITMGHHLNSRKPCCPGRYSRISISMWLSLPPFPSSLTNEKIHRLLHYK